MTIDCQETLRHDLVQAGLLAGCSNIDVDVALEEIDEDRVQMMVDTLLSRRQHYDRILSRITADIEHFSQSTASCH